MLMIRELLSVGIFYHQIQVCWGNWPTMASAGEKVNNAPSGVPQKNQYNHGGWYNSGLGASYCAGTKQESSLLPWNRGDDIHH